MAGHRDEVAEVIRWAEGIEKVHECIAGRFRRPEPRRRVLDYLRGLLSLVERKNGWQLAVLSYCRREAGATRHSRWASVQRLLYNWRRRDRWDADLVRPIRDDLKTAAAAPSAPTWSRISLSGRRWRS